MTASQLFPVEKQPANQSPAAAESSVAPDFAEAAAPFAFVMHACVARQALGGKPDVPGDARNERENGPANPPPPVRLPAKPVTIRKVLPAAVTQTLTEAGSDAALLLLAMASGPKDPLEEGPADSESAPHAEQTAPELTLNQIAAGGSNFIAPTLPLCAPPPLPLARSSDAMDSDGGSRGKVLVEAMPKAVDLSAASWFAKPEPAPASAGQDSGGILTASQRLEPASESPKESKIDLVESGLEPLPPKEAALESAVLSNDCVELLPRTDQPDESVLSTSIFPVAPPSAGFVSADDSAKPASPVPAKARGVGREGLGPSASCLVPSSGLELPGTDVDQEKLAPVTAAAPVAQLVPKNYREATKPLPGAGLLRLAASPDQSEEPAGTPAAETNRRMDSLTNSEQAGVGGVAGRKEGDDIPSASASLSRPQGESTDDTSRSLGAMDWQTGRPVGSCDRPSSEPRLAMAPEAARQVERLSNLVVREAALIKQHSPHSMAVVLRPDANTELFLHLTQRDGQIEACVRCDRGDFHEFNALWPQLQESLAGQKIRLAPLQESSLNNPNPHESRWGEPALANSGQHSRRQNAPEEELLDERPSSASPASSSGALHPERRRSGTRLTTSRPGWETWA